MGKEEVGEKQDMDEEKVKAAVDELSEEEKKKYQQLRQGGSSHEEAIGKCRTKGKGEAHEETPEEGAEASSAEGNTVTPNFAVPSKAGAGSKVSSSAKVMELIKTAVREVIKEENAKQPYHKGFGENNTPEGMVEGTHPDMGMKKEGVRMRYV